MTRVNGSDASISHSCPCRKTVVSDNSKASCARALRPIDVQHLGSLTCIANQYGFVAERTEVTIFHGGMNAIHLTAMSMRSVLPFMHEWHAFEVQDGLRNFFQAADELHPGVHRSCKSGWKLQLPLDQAYVGISSATRIRPRESTGLRTRSGEIKTRGESRSADVF